MKVGYIRRSDGLMNLFVSGETRFERDILDDFPGGFVGYKLGGELIIQPDEKIITEKKGK